MWQCLERHGSGTQLQLHGGSQAGHRELSYGLGFAPFAPQILFRPGRRFVEYAREPGAHGRGGRRVREGKQGLGSFTSTHINLYHTHQQPLPALSQRQLGKLEDDYRWVVKLCQGMDIAMSSKLTYAGHQRQFIKFCEAFGMDPLSVSEEELCMAVVHFATGHTTKSVRPYLSALQKMFDRNGAGPLPRGPRFLLFVKGLNRLLGSADTVVRTRALTMEDLHKLLASVDKSDNCICSFSLGLPRVPLP